MSHPPARRSGPGLRAAPALLALAALLLCPAAGARAGAGSALTARQLEERYGIAITRVGVVGAGGMVDLRFTVVDPLKARPLLGDGMAPTLLARRGNPPLTAPHHGAQRSIRLQKDAPCFVLYPNARGAVRPGTQVSVAFGDVRAGPIAAQ